MKLCWTIILSGAAMAVVGGVAASIPVLRAVQEASGPFRAAPSEELAEQRAEVFRSLNRTIADVRRASDQLALLAGLFSEATESATPVSAPVPAGR